MGDVFRGDRPYFVWLRLLRIHPAALERLLGPGKSARDRPRSRGKFIAAIRRKNGEIKSLIFQISFRNSKQSARHISSSCERAKCLRKFFVDKAGNVTCSPFNYRSQ